MEKGKKGKKGKKEKKGDNKLKKSEDKNRRDEKVLFFETHSRSVRISMLTLRQLRILAFVRGSVASWLR